MNLRSVPDRQDSPTTTVPWFAFALITAIFLVVSSQWSIPDATSRLESQIIATNPIRRLFIPVLGLFGFVDLIRPRRKKPILDGVLSLWILAFVSWALMSLFWVENLGVPVRRGVVFLAFGVCALSIATRISARDIARFVLLSSGAFLLVSIVWELKEGRFQGLGSGYRFSGVLVSNLQGVNCFFVCLSSMFLSDNSKKSRIFLKAVFLIGFCFLLLTKSRTGFAAAMLAILAYKAVIWRGRRRVRMAYWITFALMVLFLLFGEDFLRVSTGGLFLGRGIEEGGATLNGRIPLWKECFQYWSDRPLAGYGFNGFWTVARMFDVTSSQGWALASGHSIYVDISLELGFVGLFLLIGVIIGAVWKTLRLFVEHEDVGYAFLFGFLVFLAAEGLMESQFLTPNYVAFVAMVVFAHLGCSRQARLGARPLGSERKWQSWRGLRGRGREARQKPGVRLGVGRPCERCMTSP